MKSIYLLCISLSLVFVTQSSSAMLDKVAFENYAQNILNSRGIAGMGIAIVAPNEILYAQGIGYADKKNHVPVTKHSVFGAGSLSKVFTAIGVMQLAQKGLIDITKPVSDYIKDFSTRNAGNPITVIELLTHYSGLPSNITWSTKIKSLPLSELIKEINSKARLVHPPNTEYSYSNVGFTVLGRLIEVVSGMTFEDYMDKNILKPVGMKTASFSNTGFPRAITELTTTGYSGENEIKTFIQGTPAGGLYASIIDMSHFIQMILNDGSYNGQSILSKKTLQEMATPQNTDLRAKTNGGPLQGLGWVVSGKGIIDNPQVISHNGLTTGMSSSLIILPQEKLGVIVMSNTRSDESAGAVSLVAKKALNLILQSRQKTKI